MTPRSRQAAAKEFRRYIAQSNETHAAYVDDPELLKHYERFTQWQLRYLLSYFRELSSKPGYREALSFVVSELAGLGVGDRDRQLARAAPAVTALLPLGALEMLTAAARLNARTLEINLDICRKLRIDGRLPEPITERAYFAACRRSSTLDESLELLSLSMTLGRALVPTVNSRLIGLTLRAMSAPAHATGFGDLQEFFEKGYDTFRNIPDVDYFLQQVEQTITSIFERIYAAPLG